MSGRLADRPEVGFGFLGDPQIEIPKESRVMVMGDQPVTPAPISTKELEALAGLTIGAKVEFIHAQGRAWHRVAGEWEEYPEYPEPLVD